ncbi:MAG: glycosyltransferase [Thaumarchaeota archaeon]|nr:glycosyltransferase [Nitrososphaerota archaeon]
MEECGAKLLYLNFPLKMNTTTILESSNPPLWRVIVQNLKEPLKFVVGFIITLYYLRKLKPSILFLSDSTFPQCLVAGLLTDTRTVAEIQAEIIRGKWSIRRHLLVWIYRKCDRIFGITGSVILPFLRDATDQFKISVIPNTIEEHTSGGCPSPIYTDDCDVISYFGGCDEKKGFQLFLEIAKELAFIRDNTVFLFAGPIHKNFRTNYGKGTLSSNIGETKLLFGFIDEFHLEKKLIVLGERDDVLSLMAKSKVVIVPTKLPHFARPIIESFSVSTPVIASDNDLNREIINHGRNGLLVDYGHLDGWTQAIQELLDNPEYAKQVGREGYSTYVQKYYPEVVAERIKEAFKLD